MKYQLTKTNSNDSWYILPSMGGHLISYYKLSKLLKYNCIGLTCKGLEKKIPICETLEQHIDYFLNILDPKEASYNFIGYCMGGLFITELDKHININKSVIINFPYRSTNLDYNITNEFKQYDNVLYQNKLIWNEWYNNFFCNSLIELKHKCLVIESYKDSNIRNKILTNYYMSVSIEQSSHLDIFKSPYVNEIANSINSFNTDE